MRAPGPAFESLPRRKPRTGRALFLVGRDLWGFEHRVRVGRVGAVAVARSLGGETDDGERVRSRGYAGLAQARQAGLSAHVAQQLRHPSAKAPRGTLRGRLSHRRTRLQCCLSRKARTAATVAARCSSMSQCPEPAMTTTFTSVAAARMTTADGTSEDFSSSGPRTFLEPPFANATVTLGRAAANIGTVRSDA